MEAANITINCCGLHLYNVSQSPEDIKQTYKSILSSLRAWLSPKERLSSQQKNNPEQQYYCVGQANLQSFAKSLSWECNISVSTCSKQSQLSKTKQSHKTFQKITVFITASFCAAKKKSTQQIFDGTEHHLSHDLTDKQTHQLRAHLQFHRSSRCCTRFHHLHYSTAFLCHKMFLAAGDLSSAIALYL